MRLCGFISQGFMTDNLLIRGVNWVGDAVMTLPALGAIRKAMPESRIFLLAKPSVAAVYENNPNIDEIIPYDDRYRGIMGKFRLASALRKGNFSHAILLQNALDAAVIATLARIPRRSGYNRDGRGLLLTNPIPYSGEDNRMHHVDYFLELVRRMGLDAKPSEPYIHLDIKERLRARELLSSLKRPVVGINPGAAYGSAKQWLPERFAQVARQALDKLGGSAVVFGSGAEVEIADEILALSGQPGGGNIVSMAGKTSLRELVALISECDLLLTNDSGPMHIGYAVRTPLVAIFGSTDPTLTGPVGKGSVVLRKFTDCGPCFERKCREASLRCMEAITTDEVFEGLSKLLPTERAVFFDRDGTLCEDADYLNDWDNFKVLPDINSLNMLSNKGFKLIGATNQSGVARGIVDEEFMKSVNAVFTEKHGFDDFYYCPHHPDEHCPCRKPEPGMLQRARAEHGVDLKKSYMVGDNEKDLLVAKAVGARAILVQTGHLKESPIADFTAKGLKEAVEWILKDGVY
jgi:heptosyltransferase-2